MRLKAHAKINWALNVTARLPNGYHALDMLVQRIELADELEILPSETLNLKVSGAMDLTNHGDNLAYRAAIALQAATGCDRGASIALHKHIPSQAGLGGGSADAAAALVGLNKLWETGLSHERLSLLAAGLGADVPLCLVDGLMRVKGFGERISPIPGGQTFHLLILQPGSGLSTGDVFLAYDARPDGHPADIESCIHALLEHDLPALRQASRNQLQQAAGRLCAPVEQAVSELYAAGAGFSQMSGSGSAVFGVFDTEMKAKAAQAVLRYRWPVCLLTKTLGNL